MNKVSWILIATLVTMGLPGAASAQEEQESANPLQGVWSVTAMTPDDGAMIEPSQPGLFIFTDGYYSAVYSLGADPRPLSAAAFDPTSEEMIAQHETIIVNTGTYETDGSTITFRPVVAKSPEFIGGHSKMDFQIDEGVLTLTVQSVLSADGEPAPDAPGSSMTLRRLE